MDERLDKNTLRLVVAQICLSLGWHSVTRFTLDILTDIIERYLKKVSKTVAGFCQNDGRQSPTVSDVGYVFEQLGISSFELEDYLHQVEQAPFCRPLPDYPISRESHFQFPDVNIERSEFYDNHLPPLIKSVSEKEKEIPKSEEPVEDERKDVQNEENEQDVKFKRTLPLSRKRSYESPPYSPIEPKRLNLDAQQQVTDLTRPDLKVSAPKELWRDAAVPDKQNTSHPIICNSSNSRFSEKPLGEKTQFLNEKVDKITKGKEVNTSEKKEAQGKIKDIHKKTVGLKPPHVASPSFDITPKEGQSNKLRQKTPEPERKEMMSPPKPVPEKDFLSTSFSPPFSASSLSPKQKVTKSPKATKVSSSPRKSDTIPKASPSRIVPKEIIHDLPMDKAQGNILPLGESTPKPGDKKGKLPKKVKKSTEGVNEKKKKKLLSSSKVKKEKNPVKLKISSVTLQNENEKPKKKKKKQSLESEKQPENTPPPRITPSPRYVVPKLVFKPLSHPTDGFKSTVDTAPEMRYSPEKTPVKSTTEERPSNLKNKQELSFGEAKSKKSDTGGKNGKLKTKKKSVKSSGTEGAKSKEKGTKSNKESKEKVEENIMKCKFESSSEDSLRMSFTSSTIRDTPSPKKKLLSPFEEQSDVATITPIQSVTEQLKKKGKGEKKKKAVSKGGDQGVKVNPPKKKKGENKKPEVSLKKEDVSPAVKTKKTKKEKDTFINEAIQPIPKLTLKMDTSSSTANTTPTSKVVIKPLPLPTKTTEGGSTKKGKNTSSTLSSKQTPPSTLVAAPPPKKAQIPSGPPPLPGASTPGGSVSGDDAPHRGVFTVTLATTNVATAEVYYCPACQRPDDGSPMIGCDACDLWYHWPCVGVFYAPKDDEQWFCPACTDKQKKKKKKKKKDG